MSNNFFKNKSFLITGGTGTFGKEALKYLIQQKGVKKIVLFARDEHKFHDLERFQKLPNNVRLFIGDVRDENRIDIALKDIDYVLHAAALKHVPYAEYNPSECINTNITGSNNVINACIRNKVKKCVLVSTDKAVNPINLYGATKLASDKLFVAANNMSGGGCIFSVVRYGNVVGSRGSVVPYFNKLIKEGSKHLPITHKDMTRFWITLNQGIDFVLNSLLRMQGGEIFIPKIPSVLITDLAKAMAPSLEIKIIGIRPGEKLHEIMCPADDSHLTIEFDDYYVIRPSIVFFSRTIDFNTNITGEVGRNASLGYEYNSGTNDDFLTTNQIIEYNKSSIYE